MTKNTQKRPYRVFCLTHRTACLQRFSTIIGLHKPYILGLYKPNNMKQNHDTQTKASRLERQAEMLRKELIGRLGEYYVQSELTKVGVDSVSIDKTFDLYLWQRNHRIEVKTSYLRTRKSGTKVFTFKFSEEQRMKDAFDYAVCLGFNRDDTINVIYIIPQKYIHERGLRGYKISASKEKGRFSLCDSYMRFDSCRNIGFDIFTNDNKSSFTRRKNTVTKKLLQFEKDCKKEFKKEFIAFFKKEHVTIDEAMKYFNLGRSPIIKYRRKFGIDVGGGKYKRKQYRYFDGDTEDLKKEILRLWDAGLPRTEIYKSVKVGWRVMKQLCDELNLPHRSKGRKFK